MFLILLQIACAQEIPVKIDWTDRLETNGTLFDSRGTIVRDTLLTIGPMSGGARIVGDRIDNGFMQLSENFTMPETSLLFSNTGPRISVLSAGPGSQLRTRTESVSIVKFDNNERGYLIPGLERESFTTEYCVPGSNFVMTVPGFFTEISLHVGELESYRCRGYSLLFDPLNPGIILSVPGSVVRSVRVRIALNGGILQPGGLRSIQNCTTNSLVGLENIRIEFTSGSLLITPDEYVAIDEISGTCFLKIAPLSEGPGVFNPFALRSINTRITQNTLELCDTTISITIFSCA